MLHGYIDFSDMTLVAAFEKEADIPKPIACFVNQQDNLTPDQVVHNATSPVTVK